MTKSRPFWAAFSFPKGKKKRPDFSLNLAVPEGLGYFGSSFYWGVAKR
jgi:hypothetical protein